MCLVHISTCWIYYSHFCMHYFWQALKYIDVNTHLCVHIWLRYYGTLDLFRFNTHNSFKAKD